MAISNSTKKIELNYDDVRDMILTEKVHMKDSREFSGTDLALNVDNQCRGPIKSKNMSRNKSRSGQ